MDAPALGSCPQLPCAARLLIEHGADINARDNFNFTSLRRAVLKNSCEVALLLIENGADTNGIDLSWMESQ